MKRKQKDTAHTENNILGTYTNDLYPIYYNDILLIHNKTQKTPKWLKYLNFADDHIN